jgi:hypothetical protein
VLEELFCFSNKRVVNVAAVAVAVAVAVVVVVVVTFGHLLDENRMSQSYKIVLKFLI